jgi:hypothetical protein
VDEGPARTTDTLRERLDDFPANPLRADQVDDLVSTTILGDAPQGPDETFVLVIGERSLNKITDRADTSPTYLKASIPNLVDAIENAAHG